MAAVSTLGEAKTLDQQYLKNIDASVATENTNSTAAAAVLGVTTGAAVETDANGTIQGYLRGLVKNLIVAGIKLLAGENHIGEVGGKYIYNTDSFAAVAAGDYTANDVMSATVNDTGTTPLRGITLARANGVGGYLTYWRIRINNTSFTPRIRVDLYTVSAPTTALVGDNVASAPKFANDAQFVGTFEMPALTQPTGADFVQAIRDDLRIPFKPDAADTKLYYRYVLIDGSTTETAGQTVNTAAGADVN